MEILHFLSELANYIPGSKEAEALIAKQPEDIQSAFKENDSEKLRTLISKDIIFTNELKVTMY